MKLSVQDIATGVGGRIVNPGAHALIEGVGTDSRADLTGQLFVALKGDNFDAHDFLKGALEKGAAAVLVSRVTDVLSGADVRLAIIQVDDTLVGLQKLATYWRRKMKAKIIGLSGTNGKTTTKEFAAALIGSVKNVHWSKGSLNNHWGVPLSLLALKPEHEVAVIEMGMNHPGELTALSHIALPDVVLVTMVGRGHLEGLGSIEGVAKAKAEMYDAASRDALLCFNVENEYTKRMFDKYAGGHAVLTFASAAFAQSHALKTDVALDVVEAGEQEMRVRGHIRGTPGEAKVAVFGAHNITNLMSAAVLALAVDLTPAQVWAALPLCRTVWGRNQWVKLASGARVLFDGYNANPESMNAAVNGFQALKAKRKFAVLGEMKEMGEHASAAHRELGEKVAHAGFADVCFFGPSQAEFAAGLKAGGFQKSPFLSSSYEQSLAGRMLPVLDVDDLVLMKGSRGMHLEDALLALKPVDFSPKK